MTADVGAFVVSQSDRLRRVSMTVHLLKNEANSLRGTEEWQQVPQ